MYETLASFAQTWGMLFIMAIFFGGAVYAFWPKNQASFDAAARQPLEDFDRPAAADDATLTKDGKTHG